MYDKKSGGGRIDNLNNKLGILLTQILLGRKYRSDEDRGIAGVLIIGAVSLGVKSYNNYIVWIWLLQIINRRDKRL